MIPRYARDQMVSIWSPETKFRIWFEIEAHATDALAALGVVPMEAAKLVWEKGKDAKFNVARIDEIEREVKHDVIAFLTHLSEIVGPEARFVHQGMTSSDVLDTCLNVQLARAADLLIADVEDLLIALKKRALEYKMTPTIGRSHGIHAEPTTFGVKLATYYAEFARARTRLLTARAEIATCAISGAVGTFTPPISRPWAWWPRRWNGWPWKYVTCKGRKFWRSRNISRPARRAPPPCRTSAIRC